MSKDQKGAFFEAKRLLNKAWIVFDNGCSIDGLVDWAFDWSLIGMYVKCDDYGHNSRNVVRDHVKKCEIEHKVEIFSICRNVTYAHIGITPRKELGYWSLQGREYPSFFKICLISVSLDSLNFKPLLSIWRLI